MGVISSFQRMSWIVLSLVLITYLVSIRRMALQKLLVLGLAGLSLLIGVALFFYRDIAQSALVQDRLVDSIDGRKGYYGLVLNNIHKKPVFGYGNLKNDVYYENMLRITGSRDRATAESGDLHSGYFSALFLYGIPAAAFFILFVVSAVYHYSRAITVNRYFIIPFLVSILYMIGNLTNTFLFLKYISILFAIHIGIGMGIEKIRLQGEPKK